MSDVGGRPQRPRLGKRSAGAPEAWPRLPTDGRVEAHGRRLLVLMYHGLSRSRLDPADPCFMDYRRFRRQMRLVARHLEVLPLAEAVERMGSDALPSRAAALTFDDGLQSVYDLAFPVLRRHALPATVFVNSAFIDSDTTLWYCRIDRALSTTRRKVLEWDGVEVSLRSPDDRLTFGESVKATLKALHPHELEAAVVRLCGALGIDDRFPLDRRSPFRVLGASELREMAESGLIELGGHGHTHAILSRLSPTEQEHEISLSLEAVERLTGRPAISYAYANGTADDYDAESLAILRRHGMSFAVTARHGLNDRTTPRLELRRVSVPAALSKTMFVDGLRRISDYLGDE